MENEHVNKPSGGYKGKRTEGGFNQGQSGRRTTGNKNNNKPDSGFRKSQKTYLSKDGSDNRSYYKQHSNERNSNRSESFSKDRYEDDYDRSKKHESKKRTPTVKDKAKDIQPDKADIAMRFEKEKKVMQKKKQDSKKNHQQRPQMRTKRSNNIDWTREYENDSYDDDDISYYY